MISLRNSLPKKFNDSELLLRAVLPRPNYWRNGRLSSAALKDKYGLSVDRTYTRTLNDSIQYMKNHLSGSIVSFTISDCHSVSAVVKYMPSLTNKYHCEIHGSADRVLLDTDQAHELACRAIIQFSVNISTT